MSNKKTIEMNTKKELNKSLAVKFTSAAVSLIPVVGGFISAMPDIYRDYKNRQFNEFLEGINKNIHDNFTEDECENFIKKLDNLDNYKYLSSVIDCVLFSKSSKARLILGIITANYINNDTIVYEDIIIIHALKDLLDEELDTFNKIYDAAIGGGKEENNGEGAFFINYFPNNTLINTTFSKLISLNIIGNKAQSLTSRSPASWHGNITSITDKFKYYVDSSSVK